MKTGIATSEFWVAVGAAAISLGVALNLIPTGDAGQLGDSVKAVVGGVVAAISIVKYINSRTVLKLGGK